MANPAPLTDRVERSEAVDSTSEYRTAEHALVVTDSLEENQKDEGVLPTPLRKIMIPPRKKLASTASPKIGVKRKFKRNNVRKESDSEEEPVPKKPKTRLPTDPSRDQEKEMKYALKQAKAYRKGKHSNKGKSIRNLVREKVEDLVEEERRKNVKVAEKKQRLERAAGLMLETRQNDKNDKKDDEEVEDETNGKATDEFKDDLVDNGPMEEDTSSTEEGEREKDEETHLVLKDAKQNSDAESTKAQSGNGIMKLINNRSYEQKLSQLSKNLPSQEQIAKLGLASTAGPNFLGRTASLRRGVQFGVYKNKTNGYTSHDVLLPAADSHNEMYRSHAHLADMTQGNLRYMIGNHLVWKDLQGDELLSYSKDPLFLVVHALSRHHQNQGYVTIQFLVRSNAKAPDGTPAMFYSALDVYTIFDVPRWSGWGSNDNTKLHPRKFTQEYLSHGPVLTPSTGLKPALIVDLIKDGLYENFPEFEAPMNHKRTGLYTLQVVYRKIGYPPAPLPDVKTSRKRGSKAKKVPPPIYSYENCSRQVPMDEKLLNTVRKVTLNFRERPENVDPSTLEPPLHAFLCFLTFEKRQREDPTFLEWIKKHYNAQDVLELYADAQGHPVQDMTVVADNLPGYMQYLDLIRDCISLFSLEQLPDNVIEKQHDFGSVGNICYAYAAEDNRLHKKEVKSKKYDGAAHLAKLEKKRKRRNKKGGDVELEDSVVVPDVLETASNSQETPATEHVNQLQGPDTIVDDSGNNDALLLKNVADDEEIAAFTRNARSASPDKVPAFRPRSVQEALEEVLM